MKTFYDVKMFDKLKSAIDKGLVIYVFTHIRNYLLCITIITAGFFALETEYDALPGLGLALITEELAAGITILVGLILTLLNLYEAIYRLSTIKFHVILNILLISVYIIITFRIAEILWHFNST